MEIGIKVKVGTKLQELLFDFGKKFVDVKGLIADSAKEYAGFGDATTAQELNDLIQRLDDAFDEFSERMIENVLDPGGDETDAPSNVSMN